MVCITQKEAEEKRARLRAMGFIPEEPVSISTSIASLNAKVISARALITKALTMGSNPAVAFSGGKDSTVVLDLVRQVAPRTVAIFENTGNEYDETIEFMSTVDNVIELIPEMPVTKDGETKILKGNKVFWACVEKYGLPEGKAAGKYHGNACCHWLKEKPASEYYKKEKIDVVFLGITAQESRNRMMFIKRMGALYYYKKDGIYKCLPIHDWTEEDVWNYIRVRNLPYNKIYDMGLKRCGCRFCTAYLSWKEITERYNPKDTQILARKQGFKILGDFAQEQSATIKEV